MISEERKRVEVDNSVRSWGKDSIASLLGMWKAEFNSSVCFIMKSKTWIIKKTHIEISMYFLS